MSFARIQKITSKEARIIRGILFCLIAFAFLATIFYPFDLVRYFFPGQFTFESSCIILNLFGMPCPFCGMSHALAEYLRFNFTKSNYYNPSSVVFFTFLGLLSLFIFVLSLFNHKFSVSFNKKTLIIFISVLLTIWILNIYFGHLN